MFCIPKVKGLLEQKKTNFPFDIQGISQNTLFELFFFLKTRRNFIIFDKDSQNFVFSFKPFNRGFVVYFLC